MPSASSFPIVGVGASAGGVEALTTFFPAVPADAGLAYVVVTHLGPGRQSVLYEILAHVATIPVEHAVDDAVLQPNHAYVLSSAAEITLNGGRLRVRPVTARQYNPIDVFLASLAEQLSELSIGVVLSGGGSDGTLGLKAIKEAGGLTLAQGSDSTAPQYPSMPETAIAAGTVDLVLPVQDMPGRLVSYARGLSRLEGAQDADRPATAEQELADARLPICEVLRRQVGHDFAGYKQATFLRRVRRRMQVLQVQTPEAYLQQLRQDPEEVSRLFRDLLIGVTSFFRDADAFATLERTIIPSLFEGRGADAAVRIWVPGCATGEEAYSIAMLLREHMATLSAPPRVQVFASDIDEPALAVARAGRYPASMVSGSVSPERQTRFFVADGEMRLLAKQVRELCVFSSHSVLRDPPFSRMDLVSCRNLLIYLHGEVQRRIVPLFHYALRPGGHLFLGTSEGIGQFAELFAPVEKKNRIFRRRDHPVAVEVPLWLPHTPQAPVHPGTASRMHVSGLSLRQAVDRRLLERFAPAHVVVNRDGDVVHYSPGTGKYLEAAAGAPNRHLLAMARRGLRFDLRVALQEAMEQRRLIQREGVEVELDDRIQVVTISVEVLGEDQADPLFLVLFTDQGPPLSPAESAAQGRRLQDGAAAERLDQELRDTRDRLQATIEEYETALEELKSANEELVSMNEELQSTNEELQTAKEEQHSVNEELQTVNVELQSKIEELDRANSDLRNLFESTRVATIFLDRNLVIWSFTPSAAEVFKLRPSDRGRPLTDINNDLDYAELRQDVETVLQADRPHERPVARKDGTVHYLARMVPYRADDASVVGVIATFAEVTSVVRAEEHQRKLVAELNHRVKNTLAVVLSIATASLEPGPARDAFLARLRSMSRTHDLLSRDGWTAARLLEILQAEAAPYETCGRQRMSLSGPNILLPPRAALSLALVFHELATNSAKYGALSADEGEVRVEWRVADREDAKSLLVSWQEIGGPRIEAPSRRGFGSRVIEREIRKGLGGDVQLEFRADGLRGNIDVPLNDRRNASPQPGEPPT